MFMAFDGGNTRRERGWCAWSRTIAIHRTGVSGRRWRNYEIVIIWASRRDAALQCKSFRDTVNTASDIIPWEQSLWWNAHLTSIQSHRGLLHLGCNLSCVDLKSQWNSCQERCRKTQGWTSSSNCRDTPSSSPRGGMCGHLRQIGEYTSTFLTSMRSWTNRTTHNLLPYHPYISSTTSLTQGVLGTVVDLPDD